MLQGPDPVLLEVKASKAKSRRRTRQRENLRQLAKFYETDKLNGLRGMPQVRRTTVPEPKCFAKEFNDCITEAYKNGHAIASPEEGLYYVAVVNMKTPLDAVFAPVSANAEEPWLFSLNEMKANCIWAPYCPFTLPIETARALYDFIVGHLFLVVILDIAVMKKELTKNGYTGTILPDSRLPVRIERPDLDAVAGISQHLVLRVPMEAISMKWLTQRGLHEAAERDATPEAWSAVAKRATTDNSDHDIVGELLKWQIERRNE